MENIHTLVSLMRKAIDKFNLIDNGDKIAVGLSGGKDSLTLLTLLKNYQRFSPQKFDLIAIIVDLTNGKSDYSEIKKYCSNYEIPLVIEPSNIQQVVFEIRKETNPCSLCAKMRRGILNSKAKELGCTKIALGHHKDDFVETFLLSLCYEGRLSSFQTKSYLDKVDITVIRPMIFIKESQINSIAKNFPILKSSCPIDKKTKREFMKELLKSLNHDIPKCSDRIFDAIINKDRLNLF